MKKIELEIGHKFIKGLINAHIKDITNPQSILDKLNDEWILRFNMTDKGKELDIKEVILRNSVFAEYIIVTLIAEDYVEFKDVDDIERYVSMGIGTYNGKLEDDKIW